MIIIIKINIKTISDGFSYAETFKSHMYIAKKVIRKSVKKTISVQRCRLTFRQLCNQSSSDIRKHFSPRIKQKIAHVSTNKYIT